VRRRRAAVAGLASAALLVGCGFAAAALLNTTVPGGLRPASVDLHRYFSSAQLRHGQSVEKFLHVAALLAQIALVAAFALYMRYGERFEKQSAAGRVGTGILLALLGFAIAWLVQLPFDVAQLWWLRRNHVIHVGYPSFVLGDFFGLGARFVFIAAALAIVMGLAGLLRRLWWVAAVPVFASLALLQAFASPYLLGDTHTLSDPTLSARAAALARDDGLRMIPVDVEAVHGATTQPNAEAVGIGPTRRIVLWDTLLNGRFTQREVVAVLAHELGHLKRDHILKEVGWYALFSLVIAVAVALATRRRGGMYEARAIPVALFVYVALQFVATPVHNVISRRYEQEADWISLQTTRDPAAERSMFRRLAVLAQADPSPPTWAYVLFADHPTMAQRLAMVDAWQARQPG
jgi:STE24 endopeptidase